MKLFKKLKGFHITPHYYFNKIPVIDLREWDHPFGGYPLAKYNYRYTGNDLNGLTEAEIKLKEIQDFENKRFSIEYPHPSNYDY